MTRAHRLLLTIALGFVPGLLPAGVQRAGAQGLQFVEAQSAVAIRGIAGAAGLAVSPEGRYVYVAGEGARAVGVFARDSLTGRLTLVGTELMPARAEVYPEPHALAISADGATVYVVEKYGDALIVFARDPASGGLTLLQQQHDGQGVVNGLESAQAVVVSPDGTNVYVAASGDDAVAVFRRDVATGLVTFLEQQRDGVGGVDGLDGARGIAISPDGLYVYVAGANDGAVAIFARTPDSGALASVGIVQNGVNGVVGLRGASFVTVTPDGAQVLAAGGDDDTLVVFRRDPATGGLTFVEAHEDEVNGVNGLNGPTGIAVSPDGTHVYVAGEVDNSLAVFRRDPLSGALTYVGREWQGDSDVSGLASPQAVLASPDGRTVYTTGFISNAGAGERVAWDSTLATFRVITCGDGIVDRSEECDDGNAADGDCCSALCEAEPARNSCPDDGNACTDDRCDGLGACLHPARSGPCDDDAFCTVDDTCRAGICEGSPRRCAGTGGDQCHEDVCEEDADMCASRARPDGTACDDGDRATAGDTCRDGACSGTVAADRDGDHVADVNDFCPDVADPEQADEDHDGVGDACQCTARAPGRCLAGGGPATSDCLLEFDPSGPVVVDGRTARLQSVLRCVDGDPTCDRDGQVDGRCTFGIAVCFANADPRLARCRPTGVASFEVLSPKPARGGSALDQANALALEQTVAALGLEIRRQGRPVVAGIGASGRAGCSALADVVVPAPTGRRPVRRKLQTRATAASGRRDVDRITFECRR